MGVTGWGDRSDFISKSLLKKDENRKAAERETEGDKR